ncbi:MAG: hypothetical protein MUE60_14390 [Candidatus Eisenbacteria bacterium]|nr:hypothetical protein [Candidatus Eisenbacteria bacterium]
MIARCRPSAILLTLGIGLVAAAILLNQWSLGKLLSPDGSIGSKSLRAAIWIAELALLLLGLTAIRCRHRRRVPVPSLANGTFLLLSTCAALIGAEFALRAMGYRAWRPGTVAQECLPVQAHTPYSVAHPTLGHTIQPGRIRIVLPGGRSFTATHLEDCTRATRSLDARMGTVPQGEIWVFGCSFTYGWAVDDHETFPWRLQELLPGFDIVNLGISGYGTLQAFTRFEEALAQRTAPKIAILAYASIQEERNVLARSWKKNLAQLGKGGLLVRDLRPTTYRALPGARRWALANAMDDALNKVEVRLRKSNRVSKAIVEAFYQLAEDRGVNPLIACLTDDPASQGILDHCRRARIPCVDVSVDLTLPQYTNLPSDPHPSPLAHQHYAAGIHDCLAKERRWLPAP